MTKTSEPRRRRIPVTVVLLIGLLLFGYAYRVEPGTVSQREITIWRQ